ncbi:DNA phosphorothioation-associated putative methyltransferase [Lusitaniella coriacea]|uniref:DNA phosphorothioation-associated putative methyltransferase n=1 Tax=Lusitaniella coriacea TaxID=1983105 RepID=UPI003CF894DB
MGFSIEQFNDVSLKCQSSAIGKHLPNALYVHCSALPALDRALQDYEQHARGATPQTEGATLIKFNTNKPTLSYLFYPDFDKEPHPALQASLVVDLQTLETQYRDYSTSNNPPILHRKETFVTKDYDGYEQFADLTRQEEELGLLENSRFIGTRQQWLQRLAFHGVEIQGHELIQYQETGDGTEEKEASPSKDTPISKTYSPGVTLYSPPEIERHKAALARKTLSRPVRAAIEAGLFESKETFFDYGCGYGVDVEQMAGEDYESSGWDPYYRPDDPLIAADIVNLGYVINVIEDTGERREALVKAWDLTRQVLIVSAQVLIRDSLSGQIAYGDGIITRRNTFQKYYEQEELKTYIDQVLAVDSIPVGLGIYFVFRDEVRAEAFRASRFRSRATTPRVRDRARQFEDYEVMLDPLMTFVTERGRLPIRGELSQESEILGEFGNYRRAFKLIVQATDEEEWDAIAEKRRQDITLYLALSHFGKRPKASELTQQMREDCKALFGSYKKACLLADMMLFSLSDLENITDLCQMSSVGKQWRNSFVVHISALETLDPLLRLYEGCASRTIGRLESVTLVKFHLNRPQISYLFYPHFDDEPHPALQTSMHVDLRDLEVVYQEYDSDNPPILHEKDTFVLPDYPNYEKFAKLTQQERDRGLLENRSAIRHKRGWLQCLEENCITLNHHRLFWKKDADPYKLKVLRSAMETRRRQRKAQEKKRIAESRNEGE